MTKGFFSIAEEYIKSHASSEVLKNREVLSSLEERGILNEVTIGEDNEIRAKFVGFQAFVENVINYGIIQGSIKKSVISIHTKDISTALCGSSLKEKGSIASGVASNPGALKVTNSRSSILNTYLESGGNLLSIRLSSTSREEREQAYFNDLKSKHPNLKDCIIKDLPNGKSGSTDIVELKDGSIYLFSIRAVQAIEEQIKSSNSKNWSLWLGDVKEKEVVSKRYKEVKDFLSERDVDINKSIKEPVLDKIQRFSSYSR